MRGSARELDGSDRIGHAVDHVVRSWPLRSTSAPSLVAAAAEASAQAIARTWCPTLMSSEMTADPTPPDPPVTKLRTVGRAPLPLKCNTGTVEGMSTKTIGFAVAEEDEPRLERLTQRFGHGNRSAFLREAMHQMEVVDRAGRLAELQAYGVERSAAAGLSHDDAVQVVRRALRRR